VIVFALLAIVLVPLESVRRTERLRTALQTEAEPARGEITRIHLALASGEDLVRDHAGISDSALRRAHRARIAQELATEAAARARLHELASRLGPAVDERLDSLEALATRWRSSAIGLLALDGTLVSEARAGAHQEAYVATLGAAARLDEAVTMAAQERRREIERAERATERLRSGLGLVALAGALAAGWLGYRLRRFAVEAEQRRLALEQAMEMKARFTRGLSHDLKNPLGAIDGHASLLETGVLGELAEPQLRSVVRIRAAVRSLTTMVGDLLELAAAETGELRVQPRTTGVRPVLEELADEYRASATAAGLTLRCESCDDALAICADPLRVHQIVGNLLSNAVKYTPRGGLVTIRALPAPSPRSRDGRRARHDGTDGVAIEVIDTGPGIPPDKREVVFDEFARLHGGETPGAGLGLAISRRIARLMGGEVTVDGADGGGAVFALWLPADAPRR
jgi:signal transduction histidine kinase